MAIRMQQRRGTAAQWVSSNAGDGPILNAGEIGWESDTNKFKIGDGTNNWADLTYFVDATDVIAASLGGYVEDSDIGAISGVAGLNADQNVKTKTGIEFEGATADSFETFVVVTDPTADRTITLPDATGTVALTSDITVTASSTTTLSNKSISLGSNTVTSTLAQLNTAVSDADVASLAGTETFTNKTLTSPVINTPTGITKSDVGLANVDNTTDANKPVSTLTQTAIDLKANLAGPALTGTTTAVNLTLSGDLTVNGTTTTINSTTIPTSKTLVVTTDKLSVLAATTSAELAGVISDETGSGALVFGTSPTLVTPALGTPASGVMTNVTGLPLTTGTTGTLATTKGGTNQTTYTTGDTLYASASNTLSKRTIGSTGDVLTVAGGIPTWAAPAGGGGMTLIASGTLVDGTNSFTSIPGTFVDLVLYLEGFRSNNNYVQNITGRLNNYFVSGYDRAYSTVRADWFANTSPGYVALTDSANTFTYGTVGTNTGGILKIEFPQYTTAAGKTKQVDWTGWMPGDGSRVWVDGHMKTTDQGKANIGAITSIEIFNLDDVGTYRLYGVK